MVRKILFRIAVVGVKIVVIGEGLNFIFKIARTSGSYSYVVE